MTLDEALTLTDFVSARARDDDFFRRILPPLRVTNDELDRSVDTDIPVWMLDYREPEPLGVQIMITCFIGKTPHGRRG